MTARVGEGVGLAALGRFARIGGATALTEEDADVVAAGPGVLQHENSGSKPTSHSMLNPNAPAYSCARAPNWIVLEVIAK